MEIQIIELMIIAMLAMLVGGFCMWVIVQRNKSPETKTEQMSLSMRQAMMATGYSSHVQSDPQYNNKAIKSMSDVDFMKTSDEKKLEEFQEYIRGFNPSRLTTEL